jgi:DNA-directed RNA polymerase specialized sigma24 family protein
MGTPWLDAAWSAYAASKGEDEAGQLWKAMERWAGQAHKRFLKHPCPETAQDIVALGWEKIGQFDPQRGNFTNWFGTLCYNQLRKLYKRQRREVSFEGLRPIGYEPAWMHRSELEQRIVDLWQQGAETWSEIGEGLGLDPSEVRSKGFVAALKEVE